MKFAPQRCIYIYLMWCSTSDSLYTHVCQKIFLASSAEFQILLFSRVIVASREGESPHEPGPSWGSHLHLWIIKFFFQIVIFQVVDALCSRECAYSSFSFIKRNVRFFLFRFTTTTANNKRNNFWTKFVDWLVLFFSFFFFFFLNLPPMTLDYFRFC